MAQSKFDFAPHYLFSDVVYVAAIGTLLKPGHPDAYRGGPPLLHYLEVGSKYHPQTHPLFDPAAYAAAFERARDKISGPEIDRSALNVPDLLRHYVEFGVPLGVAATTYFDAAYYTQQHGSTAGDPLRQYLMPGGFEAASPHPAIDVEYYVKRARFDPTDVPPLLHLLSTTPNQRVSPHPLFDAEFYRATHPEIGSGCPILHFMAEGMQADAPPNGWFSHDYVLAAYPQRLFGGQSVVREYFAGDLWRRARLVFVSHDASLTGAPGTILRLIEDVGRQADVECWAIVAQSGPRSPDFRRAAHARSLNAPFHLTRVEDLRRIVEELCKLTALNTPVAAIVNSAESRFLVPLLKQAGIPTVTLVHEAAGLYAANALREMVEASDRLVFSSYFILNAARRHLPLPPQRTRLISQGLQRDQLGAMPRAQAREAVFGELKIPTNTHLVVGCGTIDFRKGVDLFIAAAADVLRRKPADQDVCFIWIGAGERSVISSFVREQIAEGEWQEQIRFIGERSDIEPYFVAADVFLMTSRVDPFPCVCQEAMACGVPIVTFRDGGGTVEMIGDGAGFAVPSFDPFVMADRIIELLRDIELRQEIGRNAKRIAAERWAPADYASALLELVDEVSEHEVGKSVPEDISGGRVFLMFDDWCNSTLATKAESAVRELRLAGVNASILLTRGRFGESAASNRDRVPRVPYIVLQPESELGGHLNGTSSKRVFEALLRFCRGAGPAVLVSVDDPLAASMSSVLPANIRIIGWLEDDDQGAIQDMYQVGPDLDCILTTPKALAALSKANPALEFHARLIESGNLGGRDSQSQLLQQLANIKTNGAIRLLRIGDRAFDSIPWPTERRQSSIKN